jgi:hypothetical protein
MTINIINEYAVNDNDDDNSGRISLQSVAMTIASELNNKCEIVSGKNRKQPSFLIMPNDPAQYYKIRIWSMTHPRTGEPYPTYNTILYGDEVAQHAERAVPLTYASAIKTAKLMPKANKAMKVTKISDKSDNKDDKLSETTDDEKKFKGNLKKAINDRLSKYYTDTAIAKAQGKFKWDVGDVVYSERTSKTYNIIGLLVRNDVPMYFYNRSTDQEQGMFYADKAHASLKKISGKSGDDDKLKENFAKSDLTEKSTGLKPETIKRYLEVARKQRDELKKHAASTTEYRGIAKRMTDRREAGIEKAEKRLSDLENRNISEELYENLRDWFGKGKEGGAGGGGWDRYNTKGERIGKCGERKPDEGKPKCLSKQKAAQLRAKGGKKAIAAAVNKKRREDPNPTRKGPAKMVSNKTRTNEEQLDEFVWTNYEGVPVETRMLIAEAHFTNKNLFESNDSESNEYFCSLQSMSSPLKKNNKYIISVLGLINNNVVQLQPPEIITLLQKKGDSYLVRRNNGQKTEFPAKHLREKMTVCSFFFDNSKAYDKFRNIMSLKYDLSLPNINLQALSENMNKTVCPHCSGPLVEFSQLNEKKDSCYYKVKSRYKVWPSAYGSGSLVKCRKVGAKNWGNKSKKTNESSGDQQYWILYADSTAVAKYTSKKEADEMLYDLSHKYSNVKFKIVHQTEDDAIENNNKNIGK